MWDLKPDETTLKKKRSYMDESMFKKKMLPPLKKPPAMKLKSFGPKKPTKATRQYDNFMQYLRPTEYKKSIIEPPSE